MTNTLMATQTHTGRHAPPLPMELVELVLLHLPAQLVLRKRLLSQSQATTVPRYRNTAEKPILLTVAELTRWGVCILPPCVRRLPASAIVGTINKFAGGTTLDDWDALFSTTPPYASTRPDFIVVFLIQWYKCSNRNDSLMYAAFDCAMIHNRIDVLQLWRRVQVHGHLPERTGMYPQPGLPLAHAVEKCAFDAILLVRKHLPLPVEPSVGSDEDENERQERGQARDAFVGLRQARSLLRLLDAHAAGSPQCLFLVHWIREWRGWIIETGDLVMFACEQGRVDVLDALAGGEESAGIRDLLGRIDSWELERVGSVAIQNERWVVLKWWTTRGGMDLDIGIFDYTRSDYWFPGLPS